MKFEIGKCYRHNGGSEIKIVGTAKTTVYGKTLVAEDQYGNSMFVGKTDENAVNWSEIPEAEWMKNFSK